MANSTEVPLNLLVGQNRAIAIVDSLTIYGKKIADRLEELEVKSIQFPHLNCLEKDKRPMAAIICCMRQINSAEDIIRPYASARKINVPLILMPTQTRMSATIQQQISRTDGKDKAGIIIELVPKLDTDQAIKLLTQGLRQMAK
jgi:hypothetical protein